MVMGTGQTKRPARLLLLIVGVFAVVVLSGCTPEQQLTYDLVNQTRAENGLPQLWPHLSLMNKAQAWAEQLAAEGQLRHSVLPEGVEGDWLRLAENVGRGPSIEVIHQAYLQSPSHRANILDRGFNFFGVGVATAANGTVYTVQVFARY